MNHVPPSERPPSAGAPRRPLNPGESAACKWMGLREDQYELGLMTIPSEDLARFLLPVVLMQPFIALASVALLAATLGAVLTLVRGSPPSTHDLLLAAAVGVPILRKALGRVAWPMFRATHVALLARWASPASWAYWPPGALLAGWASGWGYLVSWTAIFTAALVLWLTA